MFSRPALPLVLVLVLLLCVAVVVVAAAQGGDDGDDLVQLDLVRIFHPKNGSTYTGNEIVFHASHSVDTAAPLMFILVDNHHFVPEGVQEPDFFSYRFGLEAGWHHVAYEVVDKFDQGRTVLARAESRFYVADPAEAYQPKAAPELDDASKNELSKLVHVLETSDNIDECTRAFRTAVANQPTNPVSKRYRYELYLIATKFDKKLPIDQLFQMHTDSKPCYHHSKDFWMEELHSEDPYDNFDKGTWTYNPYEFQGYDDRLMRLLIGLTNPGVIGEVGSWKGGSAIKMSKILADFGRKCDAKILCIDTWLGTSTDYKMLRHTNTNNGYPNVYRQFMYNIIHANVTETVIPFPAPSSLAAEVIRHKQDLNREKYILDLAFIDANHDYQDVKMDLENFFPLLSEGGMMFGDDYSMFGVHRAVTEFATKYGLTVKVHNSRMWVMI